MILVAKYSNDKVTLRISFLNVGLFTSAIHTLGSASTNVIFWRKKKLRIKKK